MSKHEQRVRTAFKTIDGHAFDKMAESFAEDCDLRMNGEALGGLAGFRGMVAGWMAAFPDLQHEVIHYAEDGDRAGFVLRVTGTHTATMRTPNGDIPATGKRIAFESIDSARFGADGKAVEWHGYFDMLVFLEQLGLA